MTNGLSDEKMENVRVRLTPEKKLPPITQETNEEGAAFFYLKNKGQKFEIEATHMYYDTVQLSRYIHAGRTEVLRIKLYPQVPTYLLRSRS